MSRQIYWPNPFVESVLVGDYLQRHSMPGDRIAVLGSEPQIFFYSDRLSATGYVYMYELMEPQPFAGAMQADMIREIESAKPRFLVLVNVPQSWLVWPDSIQSIQDWAAGYVPRHYRVAGLVEVHREGPRAYWGREASRTPASPYYLTIWRRDESPGDDRPPR